MTLTGSGRDLRRRTGEDDDDDAPVGNAELFFDLVFVFAVTQLSHLLIAHPTPGGALHAAMLFLAVWWVWIDTVWVANWLDVERMRVRLMLFAMMTAGLFLSMSLTQAFGGRGLPFAAAFVAMQVGRSLFAMWAVRRHDTGSFRNFARITAWNLLSAPLWIAGGLADPANRTWLWLAALTIDTGGPLVFFWTPGLGRSTTADWDIAGSHIAERCGLFIIIALGESILVTGATFAQQTWTREAIAAGGASLVTALAMWWLYFDIGAVRASHRISQSDDPGREGRLIYTYLHIPLVAAIIVTAAGDDLVLAHPHAGPLPGNLLSLGGAALYVAGNMAFKRATAPRLPLSHLAGLAALALLALATLVLSPLAMSLATATVLVGVAIWETLSLHGTDLAAPEHEVSALG